MTDERRACPDRRQGVRGGRRESDWTLLVAVRLNEALRRRRMTNRHLALRTGLDERTVRNVLNGQDAKLTTIERIASVLELDLASLISPPAA